MAGRRGPEKGSSPVSKAGSTQSEKRLRLTEKNSVMLLDLWPLIPIWAALALASVEC